MKKGLMKCEKCGTVIPESVNYCPICMVHGDSEEMQKAENFQKEEKNLINNVINNGKSNIQEGNKYNSECGSKYILITIISIFLSFIVPPTAIFGLPVALIAITTGKIKYPSKEMNLIFWLVIVFIFVLPILGFILLIETCKSCSG